MEQKFLLCYKRNRNITFQTGGIFMKTSRKRLLCLILCLLMILSCVPIVGAEEGASGPDDAEKLRLKRKAAMRDDEIELAYDSDTIYTGKWTTLAEDGTYSVELHSFVTGDVTPKPVPMDIVLVMDQSASMTNNAMKETPETVRFMTPLTNPTYGSLSGYSRFYYYGGDGYYYGATVEVTNNGTMYATFTLNGSRYYTEKYATSITTANGVTGNLSFYHCPDQQVNFVRKSRYDYSSWSTVYYYQNASNASERTTEFSTAQAAFDYVTNTYYEENYSEYKLVTVTSNGTTSTEELCFCMPVDGSYWLNTQFALSYYKDGTKYSLETVTSDTGITSDTLDFPTDFTHASVTSNVTGLYIYSRNDALQEAAYDFVLNIQKLSADQGVDHRMAVVGFGSGKDYTYPDGSNEAHGNAFLGTELLSTTDIVNYADADTSDYQNALQSSLDASSETGRNHQLLTAIERIEGKGNTYPNYGLEIAKKILDARSEKTYPAGNRELPRKTIVILFTDGMPAYEYDYFADLEDCGTIPTANRTIAAAQELKKDGVAVYSIGMLDGISPEGSINFSETTCTYGNASYPCYADKVTAINAFMHFVSSDYPEATDMLSPNRTTVVNNGYFYAANTANALDQAFTNISENVAATTVALTSTAMVRDVMAVGFDLPDGIEENPEKYVHTFTVDYLGNEQWAEPVWTDAYKVTIDLKAKAVNVTGFDYDKNYIHEAYTDSNGNSIPAGGKRLVVLILGVTANDNAVQNSDVNTNDPSSGIYVDGNLTSEPFAFAMPTEHLQKQFFVMDYFAPAEIDPEEVGVFEAMHLNKDGMAPFNPDSVTTKIACANGTIELKDGKLVYTPVTPDFHEADSFYLYGKGYNDKGEVENVWAKLTILPANNVLYEDDHGVTYGGTWVIDGTPANSTETFNNPVHGYIESKANEQGHSNGSAHRSNQRFATAEFTFIGTGIDIYTRTGATSGMTMAELFRAGETEPCDVIIMDNLSSSGTYYQIPTMFFHGLDYGTYTVKITIKAPGYDSGRGTYHLDGYRVYNPLSATDADLMKEAYGNEYQSEYESLRDKLIGATDAEAGIQGAVFIDDADKDAAVDSPDYNSSSIQDYIDYGPKNEIYLYSGNSILLKVDPDAHYFVGIKSPKGGATVTVSNGEGTRDIEINSATDMFYEIIPSADGYLSIKNTSAGDGLIALTKLRISGTEKGLTLRSATVDELLAYANSFDTLESSEDPIFLAPSYNKEPKQPKSIFRNIKKPILGREQK